MGNGDLMSHVTVSPPGVKAMQYEASCYITWIKTWIKSWSNVPKLWFEGQVRQAISLFLMRCLMNDKSVKSCGLV